MPGLWDISQHAMLFRKKNRKAHKVSQLLWETCFTLHTLAQLHFPFWLSNTWRCEDDILTWTVEWKILSPQSQTVNHLSGQDNDQYTPNTLVRMLAQRTCCIVRNLFPMLTCWGVSVSRSSFEKWFDAHCPGDLAQPLVPVSLTSPD